MKKILKAIAFFLLCILFLNTGLNQAHAYYACSTNELKCADATLEYGQSQYVASASVYFNSGESISYSWENDAPGIMQVEFYVSRAGQRASKPLYATRDGDNWGVYPVEWSGYYYLFAACEGGNDTRCQGGGKITKY